MIRILIIEILFALAFGVTCAQTRADIIMDDGLLIRVKECLETQEFDDVMGNIGVDADIARAVVFPEVWRHNALRDKIEISALKTLYVQFGARYSNFSVGIFQMKPTFAEELERALLKSGTRKLMSIIADTSHTEHARKRRIERLTSIRYQIEYLALFMTVVNSRFPEISEMSEQDKVKFYATAYNYNYMADKQRIIAHQKRKEFHTDLFRTGATVCYNYSDLALQYYLYRRNEANRITNNYIVHGVFAQ